MRVRVRLGAMLLVLALLLAACTPSLEVVPNRRAPLTPVSTVTPQQHDLAIVAVDFDPPLDFAQIRNNGGVTLLVAVENRGQSVETDVRITAQLQDPNDRLRELSREAVIVGQLNAGAPPNGAFHAGIRSAAARALSAGGERRGGGGRE